MFPRIYAPCVVRKRCAIAALSRSVSSNKATIKASNAERLRTKGMTASTLRATDKLNLSAINRALTPWRRDGRFGAPHPNACAISGLTPCKMGAPSARNSVLSLSSVSPCKRHHPCRESPAPTLGTPSESNTVKN